MRFKELNIVPQEYTAVKGQVFLTICKLCYFLTSKLITPYLNILFWRRGLKVNYRTQVLAVQGLSQSAGEVEADHVNSVSFYELF